MFVDIEWWSEGSVVDTDLVVNALFVSMDVGVSGLLCIVVAVKGNNNNNNDNRCTIQK